MLRIVHFSDVHVQVDYRAEPWLPLGWRRWAALVEMIGFRREARYANAEQTLGQLAAEAVRHRADHVILSGDLTAMALDEEFRRAKVALAPVAASPKSFSVIPGNHDVYARDAWNEDRFGRHFGEFLKSDWPEYSREGAFPYVHLIGDGAAVVGLLSARVPLFPGAAVGWVGKKQLEALTALVRDPRLEKRFVFVAVHHAPLNQRGVPDSPTHGLHDAKELLRICTAPNFAVLHGHIHRRYHHAPAMGRPHIFGAGSSTSKGDEGYWLYEVDGGRLVASHKLRIGEDPTRA
jgi:3',5'-cyclic AMP phosphodiesterase CpdA